MDDVDRAQITEEQHRAAALERAAALARTALGRNATSTVCEDCGGPIEAPRQVYHFATCSHCAKDREYYAQHGRTYR